MTIAGFVGERMVAVVVFSTVLDEAELEAIFVHADYRREAVAAKMLQAGLIALQEKSVRMLFLEVDAANTAAIKLYEANNFLMVEQRKGYYKNSTGNGDAIIMHRDEQAKL